MSVDSQQGFATGPPQQLFRADRYDIGANSRPSDVSPDGKRFVFSKSETEAARPGITVVTNWLTEVAARRSARSSPSLASD